MKKVTLAGIALLALVQGRVAKAGIITSTFDTDADGWTHGRGDQNSHVVWSATGGNPGGCLQLQDQAAGTTDYWSAPAKFLGNRMDAYLGTLEFDVKIDPAGTVFSDFDVLLIGGGHELRGLFDVSPTDNYVHANIFLQEGPKWYYDGSVFGPPSVDKFQAVLADLTGLQIRGDYLNAGETDSLDNVVLTTVPEPGVMGVVAVAGLVLRRRARR